MWVSSPSGLFWSMNWDSWGGSEELLHCRRHRLDIDQGLRRDTLLVLGCHTLTHDSLQSGQTDPVLVLEQLAHRADAAVAQMVDVIVISDAIFQMDIIVMDAMMSSFVICFGIRSWMSRRIMRFISSICLRPPR